MATKKSDAARGRPVVVTTAHRGVFAGYTTDDGTSKTITITSPCMIVYYSAETRGVVGLAVTGPARGSRVTPLGKRAVLQDVTAVFDATPEAAAKWEAAPWG